MCQSESDSTVLTATRDVGPILPAVRLMALDLIQRLYDNEPVAKVGGVRVMLDAIPREPTRRLQPL